MMTRRKLLAACLTFIVLLTAARLVWIHSHTIPPHPAALNGTIDLRGWKFAEEKAITLDGQWTFYPHMFLYPRNGAANDLRNGLLLDVPGSWNTALSPVSPTPYGYGTYRLHIRVDPVPGQGFGVYIPNMPSSSALYINGKLRFSSGQPATDKEHYTGRNVPYSMLFTEDGGEIDLVIQTANFDAVHGGIIESLKFGSAMTVYMEEQFSIYMQLTVVIVLLVHGAYVALLYMIGVRQKALLTFALLVLSAAVMVLTDDDKLLLQWLPINLTWGTKLLVLSFPAITALLLSFVRQMLPAHASHPALRLLTVLMAIAGLLVLVMPVDMVHRYGLIMLVVLAVPFLALPWVMVRAALNGEEGAIFLLLGTIAIVSSAAWGFAKSIGGLPISFYPFDLIACFLTFASFWFKNYFRNAAETAKLAAQLKQANERKDEFLANTSHELRNPLHGMLNIAQAVLEREKSTLAPKSADNIDLLLAIGRRMSFMLNDLLDLNRLHNSSIRLQPGPVRIQAVAAGVIDMLHFMTEGKQIRLVNSITPRFPPVHADENRLVQIMFNLMHNAVKFTGEGTITIDASVHYKQAVIRIADTGIGMDEATRKRVFLPYEQGDSGHVTGGGGIGLGLSISRQLVELHGGALDVESTPGEGSVFIITLPLAERSEWMREAEGQLATAAAELSGPPAAYSSAAAAACADGSSDGMEMNRRDDGFNRGVTAGHERSKFMDSEIGADKRSVLAVDDDPVNLNILRDILPESSYEVTTATTGSEALALLDMKEWDLVIADIMMPRMSGYALTRAIRERFTLSELPILLLTARGSAEDLEAGFLSGANDYVMKPMDAMELRARVGALTSMRQSVREQLRIEAACLQAQIQPHFLFNTLNSIAALSEIDTARMLNLLDQFGHYLQTSFDFRNVDRLVPLSHELELVRSYLFIEKERFEERLTIQWEIDDGDSLQLPPLSIQPLVENAVKHGILAKPAGGLLTVRIRHHANSSDIAVIDDGVGMDEETVAHLLVKQAGGRSGVGLYNTDRRLRQLYGKGLHIFSEPGEGTTVTFTVPKTASDAARPI